MKITTISTVERRAITESILSQPLLRGLDRTQTKGKTINLIAECLRVNGFDLNMVSGDTMMGDTGNRQLSFSRTGEDQSIENAAIALSWTELSGSFWTDHNSKRYEFIAYVS